MDSSKILIIIFSILEVSIVFSLRKKKFDFGEFLSCLIPAAVQVGFLYVMFFENEPTTFDGHMVESFSPWLIISITGGSLLLYLIFADKADLPKTTNGWMWFVTGSLIVTSIITVIIETFLESIKKTDYKDTDPPGWVPPCD